MSDTERSPIRDIKVRSDGNPSRTSTLTITMREPSQAGMVMENLPDEIRLHPLTVRDGNRVMFAVDGNLTSRQIDNALGGIGTNDPTRNALRTHISAAVIDAQIGGNLARFEMHDSAHAAHEIPCPPSPVVPPSPTGTVPGR